VPKWILILCAVMLFGLVGKILLWPLMFANRVVDVATQQLDPAELQRRYEWFKDAAAALDAKRATIQVYSKRFKALEDDYQGKPRSAWARDDREQWSIWQSECSGVRASYNTLAADYNAQMAKWNWRFTNVGGLPQGATEPLPREFKPYTED
jgi:hypothetical protein